MSLDFSAGGENPDIDTSDDDPARRKLIDVTLVQKARIGTWEKAFQFISGHKYSLWWIDLWEDIVRTSVSSKVFLLLHVPKHRDDIIRKLLISHP